MAIGHGRLFDRAPGLPRTQATTDFAGKTKARHLAETDGIAELILSKQRNGPTGTVKTAFIAGQTKFMPLAPGE